MHPTAKINRKMIQHAVIYGLIILVGAYVFYWLLSKNGDPDLLYPAADTYGDIAAIEVNGDGSQAVIIKPDGTILASPDYKTGVYDQDVAWRPDGGRLFFESDRYNQEPHLFKWNPDKGILERRTTDKRAKGYIAFDVPGQSQGSNSTALMICGGMVLEVNGDTGKTTQLLPPFDKNAVENQGSGEESGQDEMSQQYGAFGNSFVKAMWTKDKRAIVAVLDKEGGDQTLLVQDMTRPKSRPIPLAQAKHIDFDIGQKTGLIVYSVLGDEVPDWFTDSQKAKYIKNGQVVAPIKHAIYVLDPGTGMPAPIISENDDRAAFGDPKLAPDEGSLAFTLGIYKDGDLQGKALMLVPPKAGARSIIPVAEGSFSHLSWTPDGSRIVALKEVSGNTDVITAEPLASGQVTDLTLGKGSFLEAVASPAPKSSSGGS